MQTEGREAEERPGVWCTAALWEIWRQTKNWLWIRESIIIVDRKEPQYWYLTAGKKALKYKRSIVRKEGGHSLSNSYNFLTAHTTLMMVRLNTSNLLRIVLCLQQNYGILTFEEEEVCYVLVQLKAPLHWPFSFRFVSTSHYSRPFTLLAHCNNIKCCFHSWII